MWQNLKIQILHNSKTKKKTESKKKLKMLKKKKVNWDQTYWAILSQNSKTKMVTKLKNLNLDKIQLRVWKISTTQTVKNSKTQVGAKLNNSNCDKIKKNQILIKRTIYDKILLLRTTWHLNNQLFILKALFPIWMSTMLNTEKQLQKTHLSHWWSVKGPVFLIIHIPYDKIKSIPIYHLLHMHSFFFVESMQINVVIVLIKKFF